MKTANEVKKELYKSKVNAKFSHYIAGNLYYTVELSDGLYQFPIETVDKVNTVLFKLDLTEPPPFGVQVNYVKAEETFFQLSSDLGTTSFENEMKASDLNRWISKAIEKEDFIKIGEALPFSYTKVPEITN
jgi:hypothetical protein